MCYFDKLKAIGLQTLCTTEPVWGSLVLKSRAYYLMAMSKIRSNLNMSVYEKWACTTVCSLSEFGMWLCVCMRVMHCVFLCYTNIHIKQKNTNKKKKTIYKFFHCFYFCSPIIIIMKSSCSVKIKLFCKMLNLEIVFSCVENRFLLLQ